MIVVLIASDTLLKTKWDSSGRDAMANEHAEGEINRIMVAAVTIFFIVMRKHDVISFAEK